MVFDFCSHFASGPGQLLAIGASPGNVRPAEAGVEQVVGDAIDAYIYGYPLVTMDMTRKQFTGQRRRRLRLSTAAGNLPPSKPPPDGRPRFARDTGR